ARLVRYPHYHGGKIAFTYFADIWTADENGQNLRRITVHKARDAYPRISPDGKWIAFSSDRAGNLDVYVVPFEGGAPKQLTFHSADDTVLGWTPDSRGVLFTSNRGEDFAARLYTVTVDTGRERNAGADMGVYACFSPDGGKLAINRRSQVYWRKYYRGAAQSEITVMDVAATKFTDLTEFDGMDTWPMWSRDGHIYFVSDREGNGLTNIWRVPETGGKAERVTSFRAGDVRFPAISADGKVIVFEHDFGVWKLDVASRKTTPIKINIQAETQENIEEVRNFPSQADDYDVAPSGRRLAFSIHGEIFTAPVDEGDVRQITDSPARDREPLYSADGKWIAYVSDASGREEIYLIAADGAGTAQKITDADALKLNFSWSPNSKELAYTTSDFRLLKYNSETKQTAELTSSKFGSIGAPVWSPDGKWVAYSKQDATRSSDIYLLPSSGGPSSGGPSSGGPSSGGPSSGGPSSGGPSSGGEEKKVTFDSYNDLAPRFAPNGRKLFFIRSEGGGQGPFGGGSA
ncbi:MAG: S41 family peptidase, partial [Alphaproteobacteria bacterium]